MSRTERLYREAMNRLGGPGRVARMDALSGEIRRMLSLKVERTHPSLSPREVRRKVAEQLYQSDPVTQRYLKRMP